MSFDLLNPGVVELEHFTCFIENEVIVLGYHVCLLKLGVIRSKLMLGNQAAIQKQFYRVIERSSADPVFMVLHPNVQCLDVKMTFSSKDLFQNGEALRGFPVTMLFEVICKMLPYIIE